ncbi:MAG: ABC transporter permease [Deltaproteobacteria bacterium]|nr:MAG: ABC transporter permease [Deltaproteobacteria bacterium]
MLLLRLAVRNARRNVTRSALTAFTVMLGTALVCVFLSWIEGVFGTTLLGSTNAIGHVRVVDPDFAQREQLQPMYENVPDALAFAEKLSSKPGVVAAFPKIMTGATVEVDGTIGDVFAPVAGAPAAYFSDRLDAGKSLVDGTLFTGKGKEFVIGVKVAEKAKAKVGDELVLTGVTQDGATSAIIGTIVGITSGDALTSQQIWAPLDEIQYLTDLGDASTEVLVFADDYENGSDLAASLRADPDLAEYTVQAWDEREPFNGLMQTVQVMKVIMNGIMVFIASLAIWNTMTMSVLERTSEIGVLRAMGLTRGRTVLLFLYEAVLIGAMGGVAGLFLGGGLAYYLEVHGVELGEEVTQNMDANMAMSSHVYGDVNAEVLITAFFVGLLMAAVGSLVPAIRASRVEPVVAMRA